MVGEAGAVVVSEHGVRRDARLDDDVVDVVPHLLHVVALLLQVLVHRCDPPGGIERKYFID